MSRFLSGKQHLDVDQLQKIAGAFGVKAGDLLERSDQDERVVVLQPILDEIAAVANAERGLLVAALASQARFMKTWRAPEVTREQASVLQFDPQRKLRITLSNEERDELGEAIMATGKLAPRKVAISNTPVPMLGTVAASPDGRLSFTRTNETRDINRYHWDHGVRSVFSVVGDSMEDMLIGEGDLLYIRPAAKPIDGKAIIATVANDLYVKLYHEMQDGTIVLSSRNRARGYPDIVIKPEERETRFRFLGEVFGRYGDL